MKQIYLNSIFCLCLQILFFHLSAQEIVFCGDDKLTVVNYAASKDSIPVIVWQWQPKMSNEIPRLFSEKYLQTLDECKPINNGNDFLIASSKGAVALVSRLTNKVSFYAEAPNAHSIELLPHNKVAVALSTADNGNAIRIYDLSQSDKILCSDYSYSAHGVIWDNNKQVLYTLNYDELSIYKIEHLSTDKPSLKKLETYKIPDRSGHDLQWMPGKKQLIFTTEFGVFTFDIAAKIFAPFKDLEAQKDVKSISFQANSNRLMYIQSEERWWSFHINFLQPKQQLAIPSIRLYKARWINTK